MNNKILIIQIRQQQYRDNIKHLNSLKSKRNPNKSLIEEGIEKYESLILELQWVLDTLQSQ